MAPWAFVTRCDGRGALGPGPRGHVQAALKIGARWGRGPVGPAVTGGRRWGWGSAGICAPL